MADFAVVKRWAADDDAYLRSAWGHRPLPEIAATLRRTENAVKQRAYKILGTTLDRDPKQGRIRGRRINKDGTRNRAHG